MEEDLYGLVADIVEQADLLGRSTRRYSVEQDLDDYEYQQSLYEG